MITLYPVGAPLIDFKATDSKLVARAFRAMDRARREVFRGKTALYPVLALAGSCARGMDNKDSDVDAMLVVHKRNLDEYAAEYQFITDKMAESVKLDHYWIAPILKTQVNNVVTIEAIKTRGQNIPYFYAPPLCELVTVGTEAFNKPLAELQRTLLLKYRGHQINWAFPDSISDNARGVFDRFQRQAEEFANEKGCCIDV